jgi:hypothetical protein
VRGSSIDGARMVGAHLDLAWRSWVSSRVDCHLRRDKNTKHAVQSTDGVRFLQSRGGIFRTLNQTALTYVNARGHVRVPMHSAR